jgi:hypothetical protein
MGPAQAAARAGDDDNLAVIANGHGKSPSVRGNFGWRD